MIETERLIIRNPRLTDAEDVFEFTNNPPPNTLWKPHSSIEDTKRYIRDATWDFVHGRSETLFLEYSRFVIGSVKLTPIWTGYRIGYTLNPRFMGMGLATEAVNSIVKEYSCRRFEAIPFASNTRSARTLLRCGFELEAIMEDYFRTNDKQYHCAALYSKINREWSE